MYISVRCQSKSPRILGHKSIMEAFMHVSTIGYNYVMDEGSPNHSNSFTLCFREFACLLVLTTDFVKKSTVHGEIDQVQGLTTHHHEMLTIAGFSCSCVTWSKVHAYF